MLMIIAVRAFRICCCFLLLLLLFLFNLQFAERGFVCLAFFFFAEKCIYVRYLLMQFVVERRKRERERQRRKGEKTRGKRDETLINCTAMLTGDNRAKGRPLLPHPSTCSLLKYSYYFLTTPFPYSLAPSTLSC